MAEAADRSVRTYDVVVWGATGFVGKLICERLLATPSDLRWAMAARSSSKLDDLRAELGAGAQEIPVIVADASDPASLEKLVTSTKVVLSTVGPFAKYGSALVAACADHGTEPERKTIRRLGGSNDHRDVP